MLSVFRAQQNQRNLQVRSFSFPIHLYTPLICHCVNNADDVSDGKSRKEKLEQVASFSLFGNVMSMASVQLVGTNRDALLLSFKDAKVLIKLSLLNTHVVKVCVCIIICVS